VELTHALSIVSDGDFSSEKECMIVGDPLEQTTLCGCEQFKMTGVLCAHALKVLDKMNSEVLHFEALDKYKTTKAGSLLKIQNWTICSVISLTLANF
jgi:hypothetical protein